MQARTRLRIILVAIALTGTTATVYLTRPIVDYRARLRQVESRVRTLLGAMTMYAQNNRNAFPPPEQTSALLVGAEIVGSEAFIAPFDRPDEPAFFAIVPAPPDGRWSNSSKEIVPLIYSNPAFLRGSKVVVGYSDGHFDVVAVAMLDGLIKESGGHVEPVK